MLRIVCVDWHDYQGRGTEYVNILHDSVRRNLPAGYPGTFEVFTDRPDADYHPDIIRRPCPPGPTGWYQKIALFQEGLWPKGDRILYFDLDTLILGPLDDIVVYDGPFAILRDWLDHKLCNSSVMLWPSGWGHHIWNTYATHGYPDIPGGDQVWIQSRTLSPKFVQDLFPGLFVSYKFNVDRIPEKAAVCCLHGLPRPHDARGWPQLVWKIGGMQRAALDAVCNTQTDRLHANIRSAMARWLPWAKEEPAHDREAIIVGGGPSVTRFADALRFLAKDRTVFGLNNAAKWLAWNDIEVDYQVLVDARPEAAGFISKYADHYLLGSQCDQSVFESVSPRHVTLWHAQCPGIDTVLPNGAMTIGGGSSVGLCAITLAYVMGYRKIHLFGFDSSYKDSAHHAYRQTLNDNDVVLDVLAGEEYFRAAPWMVQQAEEFCLLAAELADKGVTIHVHGDGLLPELARQMEAGTIDTAAKQRCRAILKRLPEGQVYGVEVGVFTGALSSLLLMSRDDLYLWMVDSWAPNGRDYIGDSGDFHADLNQEQQDAARKAAEVNTAPFIERRLIKAMRSDQAAAEVPAGFMDFVFIDADHSYEGCKLDIEAWWPAVKPGGWLCGHDYENTAYPKFGVKRAVDEFSERAGLPVELDENLTWFVRKPN